MASGTGSCPPDAQGWHRQTRRKANDAPWAAPCRPMASMAYWEQVGVNRQQGPPSSAFLAGDKVHWYVRSRKSIDAWRLPM